MIRTEWAAHVNDRVNIAYILKVFKQNHLILQEIQRGCLEIEQLSKPKDDGDGSSAWCQKRSSEHSLVFIFLSARRRFPLGLGKLA